MYKKKKKGAHRTNRRNTKKTKNKCSDIGG